MGCVNRAPHVRVPTVPDCRATSDSRVSCEERERSRWAVDAAGGRAGAPGRFCAGSASVDSQSSDVRGRHLTNHSAIQADSVGTLFAGV